MWPEIRLPDFHSQSVLQACCLSAADGCSEQTVKTESQIHQLKWTVDNLPGIIPRAASQILPQPTMQYFIELSSR